MHKALLALMETQKQTQLFLEIEYVKEWSVAKYARLWLCNALVETSRWIMTNYFIL